MPRLSISIDDDTYQQLQTQATKDKRSLASLVRLIISQAYAPSDWPPEDELHTFIKKAPYTPPEAPPPE